MKDQKKIVAAMAAVMLHIKTEEEAVAMSQMPQAAQAAPPPVSINLWGLNGRQAMMQTRNMMQMKTYHGSNPR